MWEGLLVPEMCLYCRLIFFLTAIELLNMGICDYTVMILHVYVMTTSSDYFNFVSEKSCFVRPSDDSCRNATEMWLSKNNVLRIIHRTQCEQSAWKLFTLRSVDIRNRYLKTSTYKRNYLHLGKEKCVFCDLGEQTHLTQSAHSLLSYSKFLNLNAILSLCIFDAVDMYFYQPPK